MPMNALKNNFLFHLNIDGLITSATLSFKANTPHLTALEMTKMLNGFTKLYLDKHFVINAFIGLKNKIRNIIT